MPRTVVGQLADNAENASGVVTLLTVHGSSISTNPPSCKPLFNFRPCKSVCRARYVLIVITNCALISDWRELYRTRLVVAVNTRNPSVPRLYNLVVSRPDCCSDMMSLHVVINMPAIDDISTAASCYAVYMSLI